MSSAVNKCLSFHGHMASAGCDLDSCLKWAVINREAELMLGISNPAKSRTLVRHAVHMAARHHLCEKHQHKTSDGVFNPWPYFIVTLLSSLRASSFGDRGIITADDVSN